jgi:hydrogenase maturation protease
MSRDVIVIGIGNEYRRDDAVGHAVAAEIAARELPGVRVVTTLGEPTAILEAWSGATLAVLVDAAVSTESTPGRVRRCTIGDLTCRAGLSSHALDITQTFALGQALGMVPDRLVIFTVEAADTGHGIGLTADVAAAVGDVVAGVLAELATRVEPR